MIPIIRTRNLQVESSPTLLGAWGLPGMTLKTLHLLSIAQGSSGGFRPAQ